MPPPLMLFSKFRLLPLDEAKFVASMHRVITIGVGKTPKASADPDTLFCFGYKSQCPKGMRITDTLLYYAEFRQLCQGAGAAKEFLKKGAITLIMSRKDAISSTPPPRLLLWLATGTEEPLLDARLTPVSKDMPLPPPPPPEPDSLPLPPPITPTVTVLERPVVTPFPRVDHKPITATHVPPVIKRPAVVVDDGTVPEAHRNRTLLPRGDIPRHMAFGQSFSLSGIMSVELHPQEHTESHYVAIESSEVERVIQKALRDAYGTRVKNLRVRITGT